MVAVINLGAMVVTTRTRATLMDTTAKSGLMLQIINDDIQAIEAEISRKIRGAETGTGRVQAEEETTIPIDIFQALVCFWTGG